MPVTKGRRQGEWRGYYYDRTAKKQVSIPTEVTSQWEGLTRAEAEARCDAWLNTSGIARVRSRRRALASDEALAGLIAAFLEEHAAMRATKEGTRQDLRHHLQHYAVVYFVQTRAEKNVQRWWQHAPGFPMWLRSTYPKKTVGTVKKIIQSLRRFGEYLATHHHIPQPWLLPLPRVRQRPITPLTKALKPAGVLKVAESLKAEHPRWALAILLGYFASLRPEETYALTKADFVTGDRAERDARTHTRFANHKLGSRLSVVITKTKTRAGDEEYVKTHYSYGVVHIWSKDAAQAIGALMQALPSGPIWPEVRSRIDREYNDIVRAVLGVTGYDLRRASALYLGRELGVEPFLLQDHLRHSAITTTMLYTRRPLEERETDDTQDFTDVG